MFSLKGRGALVTGGGGALGQAVGRTLAAMGADIVLADVSGERARAAAGAVQESSPSCRVEAVEVDVSRPEEVADACALAENALGQVDVVVTAAGEVTARPFASLTLADWRNTTAAHLDGAYLGIAAALPAMRDRGRGRVVCVSSIAATQGASFMVDYAAAKGGLFGLVRSLAREVAGEGITVNAIAPGCFWSSAYDALLPVRVDLLRSNVPVGRIADPMEIASLVAYLASDHAAYTTGQVISIDGGFAYCRHVDQSTAGPGGTVVERPRAKAASRLAPEAASPR